jgi:hypothetical protein
VQKKELQEIIERVFNEYFDSKDMLWPKLQNKLLQEIGDKLTATSVKVPELDVTERIAQENDCYTLESQRGFSVGVAWAVKRMQE